MADSAQESRTEQATPRRLEQAQQKGQIAYSTDLTAAVMLLLTSLALAFFSEYFVGRLAESIGHFMLSISHIGHEPADWTALFSNFINDFMVIAVPVALVASASTLGVAGLMTGFKTSPKAFKFDVATLNPVNGFKKIFSMRAVNRGILAIAKLLVLTGIVIAFISWRRQDFLVSGSTSMESIVRAGWTICVQLALVVSVSLVAIGLLDYFFQKWKHSKDLMMSRQELVDEHKEDEGDPHMRARRKRLQRELSQRQMLTDVRSASVVITNPTHFAVALKYDRLSMPTPKVVAKGADHVAKKIIAIAKEHNVIVVERKPLARALFHTVEVGNDIPFEVFQAVAEVIAYVYQIKKT